MIKWPFQITHSIDLCGKGIPTDVKPPSPGCRWTGRALYQFCNSKQKFGRTKARDDCCPYPASSAVNVRAYMVEAAEALMQQPYTPTKGPEYPRPFILGELEATRSSPSLPNVVCMPSLRCCLLQALLASDRYVGGK